MPVPGLVAVNVCSSIHPLKTKPKPPSPKTLSGRKFLVAFCKSLYENLFKLEDCKISPSVRGVRGTETAEALLFETLETSPSLAPTHEFLIGQILWPTEKRTRVTETSSVSLIFRYSKLSVKQQEALLQDFRTSINFPQNQSEKKLVDTYYAYNVKTNIQAK